MRIRITVMLLVFTILLTSCRVGVVSSNYTAEAVIANDRNSEIKILSPITLSMNPMYNGGVYGETLLIRMVKGTYKDNWDPGPFFGPEWSGEYIAQVLDDEKGEIVSELNLKDSFRQDLSFSGSFKIEFEDYNGDGNLDFTIGQYASSNGYVFKIYTIEKDWKLKELKVERERPLFISNSAYSMKLDKVDEKSFKTKYYDNSQGNWYEAIYQWDGQQFICISKEVAK